MRVRSPEVLAECLRLGNVTQAEVARAAGCSRQFIWSLTSGERVTCSEEVATVIADLLSLDTSSLFLPEESGQTGITVRPERESAA